MAESMIFFSSSYSKIMIVKMLHLEEKQMHERKGGEIKDCMHLVTASTFPVSVSKERAFVSDTYQTAPLGFSLTF